MTTTIRLELPTFEPLLRQRFGLRVGDRAVELVLVEATSLGAAPRPALRAPFSLIFDGPHAPAFEQGTYELTHDAIGTQAIFLVPVARDADRTAYQAIFT